MKTAKTQNKAKGITNIVMLQLKKAPDYYSTLSPDLRNDVEIIKQILNRHGYDASRETIAVAWHCISQDSLCISWRDVLAESERDILNNMLDYTDPVNTKADAKFIIDEILNNS